MCTASSPSPVTGPSSPLLGRPCLSHLAGWGPLVLGMCSVAICLRYFLFKAAFLPLRSTSAFMRGPEGRPGSRPAGTVRPPSHPGAGGQQRLRGEAGRGPARQVHVGGACFGSLGVTGNLQQQPCPLSPSRPLPTTPDALLGERAECAECAPIAEGAESAEARQTVRLVGSRAE